MSACASRWAPRLLALAVAVGMLTAAMVPVVVAQEPETAPPAERQLATRPDRGPAFYIVRSPGGHREDARGAAPLRRRVSVELHGVPLAQALKALSAQSGIHFVYSQEQVAVGRVVSLEARDITVAAALTELLLDAGVDVQLLPSGQAALVRQTVLATAEETGSIAGRVTAKDGAAISGATVVVQGTSRSAVSGSDGRYRIQEVSAGSVTLRARYIGYAPVTVSVTVNAGQEATADFTLERSAQKLDDVVTTGTVVETEIKALPTPITVITAEDIERQHVRRIDDAIRLAVPGATVFEQGSNPGSTLQITLRGASSIGLSNPKLYIDGVEVSNSGASLIDPQSVDRIEIVRGPQAAALYGSDAMGGVIQVFSKRGSAAARPEMEARAALGVIESDFPGSGAVRQEYSASMQGQSGAASYRLGGGYTKTGDWLPNYGASNPSVYGGLRVGQGPLTLDLSARYYEQNADYADNPRLQAAAPAFFPAVPHYTLVQNRDETYALHLDYRPTSWWQHTVTAGVDRLSVNYNQTRSRLTTPTDTLLLTGVATYRKLTVGYHTTVQAPLSHGTTAALTAGADHWAFATDQTSVTASNSTGALQGSAFWYHVPETNTGVFAQGQLDVAGTLFLSGAIRGDWNSNFGADLGVPLSPRVGATFVHELGTTTIKLRAAYGEALRPPVAGAAAGSVTPYVIFLPAPSLRPERQIGPDMGVDVVFAHRASISVTHYLQTAKDLLDVATIDAAAVPNVEQWQNVARVRNVGWEFEGSLHLGVMALAGNYAITRSRAEELGPSYTGDVRVGEPMFGVAEHTGAATLAVAPFRRTSVTAALAYTGSQRNYDLLAYYACLGGTGPCNGFALGGYVIDYPAFTTLNVSIEQQFSRGFSAYVGVEDLTGTSNSARGGINTAAVPGRITTVGARVHY